MRLFLGAAIVSFGMAVFAQAKPPDTGGACIPASERAGRPYGCFIHAASPIGALGPGTAFWQVETYPTAAAASKAKTARGVMLEAFDKVWLLTIADSGFRSPGGTHSRKSGRCQRPSGRRTPPSTLEAVFTPGMKSRVHRHSGPEAWYTLSGETCLETPEGSLVGRAGDTRVIVPQGPPMELTATGTDVRRALRPDPPRFFTAAHDSRFRLGAQGTVQGVKLER